MSKPVSVLLVDDHAMVRELLRTQLEAEPDIQVVGAASTGDEATELARKLQPDVVLMDIDMPGQLSFTAASQIKEDHPDTRVIYLSAFFHDRYIDDAIQSQASGYLTKDEAPETILQAVRLVASGMAYFSPKVQSRLVVDTDGVRLGEAASKTRARLLTQRELEAVRYIARGLAKKEIAGLMGVSVKTVEMHTQNAMDKLDIHDRVELARYAIREGLAEA